jgi:ferric-dicitrate binding protein FerR (iron transport regulator)
MMPKTVGTPFTLSLPKCAIGDRPGAANAVVGRVTTAAHAVRREPSSRRPPDEQWGAIVLWTLVFGGTGAACLDDPAQPAASPATAQIAAAAPTREITLSDNSVRCTSYYID